MEQMAARWARLGEIRSVASGAAHVLLIRVVGAVLAYGSTIFLARTLGTFDFGLFAYFWTWIALLGVILPLGYNASVLRFLPDYKARSKWRRIHGFLREGYARSAIYGTAATLVGACLLYAFPEMVGELYFKPLLYTLLCLPFAALLTQLEASARALGCPAAKPGCPCTRQAAPSVACPA